MYKTIKCHELDRKHVSDCLGLGEWLGHEIHYKDCMETCGGDTYVHYLNGGDAFMGIYIYQNSPSYIC